VREEQALRVRNLQRERAREEQTLNDELREVLDDAEEEQKMKRSLSSGLLTAAVVVAAALASSEVARSAPSGALATSAPVASASATPGASASAKTSSAAPVSSASTAAAPVASGATVTATAAPMVGPSSSVSTASGGASSAGSKFRKGAPPPPAPTQAQLKALGILQQEAQSYESGSKDFRRNLTMIVRHHYEQRRQRVLTVWIARSPKKSMASTTPASKRFCGSRLSCSATAVPTPIRKRRRMRCFGWGPCTKSARAQTPTPI